MARLLARTPRSAELFQRATSTLPFGVVSSFQKMQPYPIYVTRGQGQPYLGPGWHASTSIFTAASAPWWWATPTRGSSKRSPKRRDGAPTSPSTTEVGGRVRRGDLPPVQSGDAPLRQLRHRGHHGRDPGGARRHRARRRLQDRGLVPRPSRRGDVLRHPQRRHDGRPGPARQGAGLQGDGEGRAKYIEVVPFNDADAARAACSPRRGKEIACLIMEPAMMNIGIVRSPAGLSGKRVRELCTRYGVVFIYDEIKTGFTIAAGRRHRALRGPAGPRLPRQGDLRRVARQRRSAAGRTSCG